MSLNVPKRSRATAEQLSHMVDFMAENPGLATGKFQKMNGKLAHDNKWAQLAEILNSFGGATKTVDQWQTVWRDLKSRTSIKVRDRKKQQALTGNRPVTHEITDIERRVVSIIGNEYIEGQESVNENVPMNEELQLRLEDGEDITLMMSPTEKSVESMCDSLDTPAINTPRRSFKRRRTGCSTAIEEKFIEIANKQADAMKMLAESSSTTQQTIKYMADAIKTMGEGLKAIADATNNLANSINRL